jgi:hypothetical protein
MHFHVTVNLLFLWLSHLLCQQYVNKKVWYKKNQSFTDLYLLTNVYHIMWICPLKSGENWGLCNHEMLLFRHSDPIRNSYTESSKKNAGIIKTYHSRTVKHTEMIWVSKCGKRTKDLDMLSWWWVASDGEMLLLVDQSIQHMRKARCQNFLD